MGMEGIEPSTQRASVVCSPTELHPRNISKNTQLLNVFSNIYKSNIFIKSMKKEEKTDNSFGIAAVLLGILSITFSFLVLLGYFAGLIFGAICVIFALKQKKVHNNKWATAGLILGLIGIALNIVFLAFAIKVLGELATEFSQLQSLEGVAA
jgi:hypothetical protein